MSYQDGIVKQTEFFTTAELAQKLKMNVQVVTRKVQSGEILAYKIGKEWRIPEHAVYSWLEKRRNQPMAGALASGAFHQAPQETATIVPPVISIRQESTPGAKSAMPNRADDREGLNGSSGLKPASAAATEQLAGTNSRRSEALNGSAASGRTTRRYLLEYILAQLEPHRSYQEHEVDQIIRRHGQDAEQVKGEMIAARMLTTTAGKFSRRLDYQLASGPG